MITVPAIKVTGATVRGPRGIVFGPLTAESSTPITLIHGSRGSGRTSFLLALAGRMRLDGGSLAVGAHDSSRSLRALRDASAIVGFDAIDALEPSATVNEAIKERLAWLSPWWRKAPAVTESLRGDVLRPAFGDLPLPSPDTLIRELSELDDALLRLALALLEKPALVVVDDLDGIKDPQERAAFASRLESVAATGIAIAAGSTDDQDAAAFSPDLVTTITLRR